jgi:ABC-type polysaccharide/polyol phosphate transport system ATPase subunit
VSVAVEPVLAVEGLTKVYQRAPARWHRILLPWSRIDLRGTVEDDEDDDDVDDDVVVEDHDLRHATVALRDVSFDLVPGLNVALMGAQGAGRRTLVRILGGFSVPTSGRALVRGTVGPTPRLARTLMAGERSTDKNILGLARWMGRSARLARRRGDEILAFAGLEQHERRLGQLPPDTITRFLFSTVLHLEPDLLLADPWYADKDRTVQSACLERVLRERDRRGMTILQRQDSIELVERYFDQALWLDRGKVMAFGPLEDVVPRYRAWLEHEAEEEGTDVAGPLHVARLVDGAGEETTSIGPADELRVELDIDASALRTAVECTLDVAGQRTGRSWPLEAAGSFVVRCVLPPGALPAGHHVATLTTTTDEVHGQRRTAQQELVVTVEGTGEGAGRPLSEIADWRLAGA